MAESGRSNPFGAARPREEVLKARGVEIKKVEPSRGRLHFKMGGRRRFERPSERRVRMESTAMGMGRFDGGRSGGGGGGGGAPPLRRPPGERGRKQKTRDAPGRLFRLAVDRGIAAAQPTQQTTLAVHRDHLAAARSAIAEAVAVHDARDHSIGNLGPTVAAILLVAGDPSPLRDAERVALQREIAQRGAEEQWVGRASEWKAEVARLLARSCSKRCDADMQTQLDATGFTPGKLRELRRAMLYLDTGDLLRCAETCRMMMRWSKHFVRAWKHRSDASNAIVVQVAARYVHIRVVDFYGCESIRDASIVALAESCPLLAKVKLEGCEITDTSVAALARCCPHLVDVNLARCAAITDASAVMLAERCPKLKTVNVTNFNNKHITDTFVAALAGNCPQLTCVNIVGCRIVTEAAVVALVESCPQLESVGGYFAITAGSAFIGDSLLTDGIIAEIARRPSVVAELATVNLRVCSVLTDASIVVLARCCPLLSSVEIMQPSRVYAGGVVVSSASFTDAAVLALAEACPLLENVGLLHCDQITDASVVLLSERCPRLAKVRLNHCTQLTDTSIVALAGRCPYLESVDIVGCTNLTDLSVVTLVTHFPRMARVRGYFNIDAECATFSGERNLTCAVVACLFESRPDLAELTTALNFPGGFIHGESHGGLTDELAISLIKNCAGLTSVDLTNSCITDATIVALAENCRALKQVRLVRCRNITDVSGAALAEKCSELAQVDFTNCTELTDVAVVALATSCPQLEGVNLSGCKKIGDASVLALAANCPQLRRLHLFECDQIEYASLLILKAAHPALGKNVMSSPSLSFARVY